MRGWWRRVRVLLRPGRARRELADEMRFHQECQREEVGRAASRVFGNDLRLLERSREQWGWLWLEQLGQDARQTGRQLRRAPGYAAAAVLILGLGIGANTALFSVVNAVLLRPLPYPHPERIVTLEGAPAMRTAQADSDIQGVYPDWVGRVHAFAAVGVYEPGVANLGGEAGLLPRRVAAAEVSPGFFAVLGIVPRGRGLEASDASAGAADVVVVSDTLAARYGGAKAVGSSLRLDGKIYRVVGVMPAGIEFPGHTQVWMPLPQPWKASADPLISGAIFFHAIARLQPGAMPATAAAEWARAVGSGEGQMTLEPLRQQQTQAARPVLWLLLGAVGLVLLIACANAANLQLTRAAARKKEMAVRLALGAGRGRIARQHFAESLGLALGGGVAGCILAGLSLPALRLLLPRGLPLAGAVALDGRVLVFALAAALGSGALVGLFASLHAFRADARVAFTNGGGERNWLRSALAVAEIALAMVLLAGAGLLLESLWRLSQQGLGFDPSQVVTAEINLGGEQYQEPARRAQFYDAVLRRVAALPGVASVGVGTNLPFEDAPTFTLPLVGRSGARGAAALEPAPIQHRAQSYLSMASPDYFRALGLPLLAGRWFTSADARGRPTAAVVNRALAQALWPDENPIGQQVKLAVVFGGKPAPITVVGEIGDARMEPGIAPDKNLYYAVEQMPPLLASLVVRSSSAEIGLEAPLRRAVAAVDADQPLGEVVSMTELQRAALADPRFRASLLALFAALALALSVAGLGGVMAFAATQRTHEIGVRMALGAAPRAVQRLMLGQGMRLALLGISLGLAAALGLARVLAHFLYGVSAYNPLAPAAMASLLAMACAGACWWPARLAARVDPVEALRCE